jgi:hypothetical protein
MEQSPPYPAFKGLASPKEAQRDNESLNGSQGSEVAAMLQEMREARKQDAELRKKELEVLLSATKRSDKINSIFKVNPSAEFPKFGDADNDVEAHLEEFEDLCNLANPLEGVAPAERLRLFGKTLEGSRLRCYKAIMKEAKRDGAALSDPTKVFDQIVAQFYVEFHETDETKAMNAKRQYDALERGKGPYQTFSISWTEALADLRAAGVIKSDKELFLDFLVKVGSELKLKILEDQRFWPIKPSPGTQQVFRKAKTWQEAAYVAKEHCTNNENSRAITDRAFQSQESMQVQFQASGLASRARKETASGSEPPPQSPNVLQRADGILSETDECLHCGRAGHPTELCPRKAAERRGESEALIAESARTGAACTICNGIGRKATEHRARHHILAAQDAFGAPPLPSPAQGKHSENTSDSPANSIVEAKGSWKSEQPCNLFRHGDCKYGDKCKFVRDDGQERKK